MSESTKVNSTCKHVQTCLHTKSIRIHVHTVMSCGAYLSISNGKDFRDIGSKT